jgi:hypothetical protein
LRATSEPRKGKEPPQKQTNGGDSETHINLKPGTNYRLAEDLEAMGSTFQFVGIVCELKTAGTRFPTSGYGGGTTGSFTLFSVVIGDETAARSPTGE